MKQLEKSLPGFTQLAMQLRAVANADDLKDDILTRFLEAIEAVEKPVLLKRMASHIEVAALDVGRAGRGHGGCGHLGDGRDAGHGAHARAHALDGLDAARHDVREGADAAVAAVVEDEDVGHRGEPGAGIFRVL